MTEISEHLQHGSVTAGVENGVVRIGGRGELREGLCVLPEVLVLLEKSLAGGVLLEHLHGGRVQGCNAALGRGKGELCAGFDENVVGVCELGLVGVRF